MYLLVKIFSIDDETVGAFLRRTNCEVRDIFHHLLHAEPIQFNATEFFIAVVICQSESECQSCSLLLKQASQIHTLNSSIATCHATTSMSAIETVS